MEIFSCYNTIFLKWCLLKWWFSFHWAIQESLWEKKISIWVDLLLSFTCPYLSSLMPIIHSSNYAIFVSLEVGWYKPQTSVLKRPMGLWRECLTCDSKQKSCFYKVLTPPIVSQQLVVLSAEQGCLSFRSCHLLGQTILCYQELSQYPDSTHHMPIQPF